PARAAPAGRTRRPGSRRSRRTAACRARRSARRLRSARARAAGRAAPASRPRSAPGLARGVARSRAGVGLEMRLVLEQRVMHRPELALCRGGLGGERGAERVRMHALEREVAPDEAPLPTPMLEDELHRRRRLPAVRAFEVT